MLNLMEHIFAEPGQGFHGCYNGWAFGKDKDRQEVVTFSCNYSTLMVFLGLDFFFFFNQASLRDMSSWMF